MKQKLAALLRPFQRQRTESQPADHAGQRNEAPAPPPPDVFPSDGLSHIAGYVARLTASIQPAAVLMVSTLDGQKALTLLLMAGRTHFHLIADWETAAPQESAAVRCFARLGVVGEEKRDGEQRLLSFALEGTPQKLTEATVAVMQEIYEVSLADGLRFRFDEWQL